MPAKAINGRAFKKGQHVVVSFNKEVTFEDGKKVRFYRLEQ